MSPHNFFNCQAYDNKIASVQIITDLASLARHLFNIVLYGIYEHFVRNAISKTKKRQPFAEYKIEIDNFYLLHCKYK